MRSLGIVMATLGIVFSILSLPSVLSMTSDGTPSAIQCHIEHSRTFYHKQCNQIRPLGFGFTNSKRTG
jgi:hypothetical protein